MVRDGPVQTLTNDTFSKETLSDLNLNNFTQGLCY